MHRVVLVALLLSACRVEEPFICTTHDQCRRSDRPPGTCESSNNCSFPDIECASGRRYDELAELSNQCVLDGDMDMIADDDDNCLATANPEQFDEDEDGLGDVCDPCPPFANNSDGDGDGVGDLCDPRPVVAGDTIAYFEGFHTALAGWTAVVGSAAVANDALTTQGKTDMDLPVTLGGNAMLLAGVTMVQAPSTGVWLGLPFDAAAGGNYCELTPAKLELYTQQGTMAPVQLGETAFAATVGEPYVYAIDRPGLQQYRCLARSAQATDNTELVYDSLADGASTRVGLGADATARFAWVMIVQE